MNNRGMAARLLGAACAAAFLITSAHAQLSGAIYTSTADGSVPNANLFESKDDVYLNGGPQNQNSAGLPPGEYYFQVTNPSGSVLLSTDDIRNRRVLVALNGNGQGVVSGPLADPNDPGTYPGHLAGTFNPANGSTPVQLMPYLDTPNNGGEYKVWLTPVDAYSPGSGTHGFVSSMSKTDNFKVRIQKPPTPQAFMAGVKYLDLNMNGERDPGEPLLHNWEITITTPGNVYVVTTNINGEYGIELEQGTPYTISETQQAGWMQTGPNPGATIFFNGNVIATADANQAWVGTVPVADPGTLIFGHDFGNIAMFRISGEKFYDANVNAMKDGGEVGIPGFRIQIDTIWPNGAPHSEIVVTDANGQFVSSEVPVGTTFVSAEIMPLGSWFQTAPQPGSIVNSNGETATANAAMAWEGTVGSGGFDGLYFGNVCLGAGGGKTLGFWSNRNGERRMDQTLGMAAALAGLSAQNLRNANGSDFDPTTYGQFRSWLLGGNATNMAYMLSVQYAAMWLNVNAVNGSYTGVDPNAIIYAPGTTSANFLGFATVGAVMAEANAELGLHGTAFDKDPWRAYQAALKNALDNANNNLNFVHPVPCVVNYPQ